MQAAVRDTAPRKARASSLESILEAAQRSLATQGFAPRAGNQEAEIGVCGELAFLWTVLGPATVPREERLIGRSHGRPMNCLELSSCVTSCSELRVVTTLPSTSCSTTQQRGHCNMAPKAPCTSEEAPRSTQQAPSCAGVCGAGTIEPGALFCRRRAAAVRYS